MKDVIISVIVPIYNAASTLDKCIQSIINQSYKNLEIILIDDGSTDNSLEICNFYRENDNRIKVFHKENGGVSSARNLGLQKISGMYISFIDSDDYLEQDMYEKMISVMKSNNSDLVICNFFNEDENGKNISKFYQKKAKMSFSFSSSKLLKMCYEYSSIDMFLWNKLYSRELIYNGKKPLLMNERISMSEDALFNVQILEQNHDFQCTYIKEKLYHYVNRNTSITNQKYNPKKLTYLYEKKAEIDCLLKNNIDANIPMALYVIFYNRNLLLYPDIVKQKELNEYYLLYKKNINFFELPFWLKIKYIIFFKKSKKNKKKK